MNYVTLSNGVEMPLLGYGVYQIPDYEECKRCVKDAIEVGYRSIDTAQAYGNEKAVGDAIKESGIRREELFITTKIWITNYGYENAKASIEQSLKDLGTDYIDLMLLHQPFSDYYGAWHALEEYYKAGKIRAIGVSNFYPDRFIDIASYNEIKPMVNQVETHVFNQQKKAKAIMQKYGCQIESWGPFAEGKNNMFRDPTLTEIAARNNMTVAQVILTFLMHEGVIVIPKSTHKERMIENFKASELSLPEEDVSRIREMDQANSLFFSHQDPDTVEWFTSFTKRS